jgi:N-acyl-D-amino-acid deacylase
MRGLARAATCLALLASPATVAAQPSTLIRGARVVDGTGTAARRADVRVTGDRIAEIGALAPLAGERVVDANGLVLAPGFIDTHSHHDRGLTGNRDALAAVSQGVTTIVVGQDGGSRLPLAPWFAELERTSPAVNVASFVGHGTVRERIMGNDWKRAASDAEIGRMRELVRAEMAAGALGLSTGLEYDPGTFSTTEEVIALARVAAEAGGRYTSHMRSEDRAFWEALDELLRIGREARIPVQATHLKLAMRALWGQGDSLVRVLDRARASGVDVTADVYPYTMWQSTPRVLYPKQNFTDRAETEFILREVAGPGDLLISRFPPDSSYVGKTVAQVAALRRTDAATTLMAIIAESDAAGTGATVIATGMDERDIARILQWPFSSVSSDGELQGRHPRGFGAFTRVLGRYVRERKVLGLEEAVRRMTSLAAVNVGLGGRGTIAAGMAADLVLFDPATVADRATIDDPRATSVGIRTVWVNGEVVYDGGAATGRFPGRVLRRERRANR